ncbi:hypothetical protein V3Q90_14895 [Flavobacterium oreochromis]|uniref:hypothetical protein n=1 Tax=Flavobacterium oreochromis TaxID=2906078 RepID=UPI00385EF8DB
MKISIKIRPDALGIITATLLPIYNTKPKNIIEKATLSIAIDIVNKLESKCVSVKSKMNLFDSNKKVTLTLKYHEAHLLELLLLQEIRGVTDVYIKQQIQKTIDELNQKLT